MESVEDVEQMYHCTTLLSRMCTNSEIQDTLGEENAVQLLLDKVQYSGLRPDQRIPFFVALASLCHEHERNQIHFRRANGVLLLHNYIENCNACDLVSQVSFMSAVLNALWSCVVGNVRSEARWFQLEGVDTLLNLLETCPVILQNQILSLLSDLCAHPKAVCAMDSWRSAISVTNATELLLSLYLLEEKRLQVQRPTSGVLYNMLNPLGRHTSPDEKEDAVSETSTFRDPLAFSRLMEALAASQTTDVHGTAQAAVNESDQRLAIYAVLSCMNTKKVTERLSAEVPFLKLFLLFL